MDLSGWVAELKRRRVFRALVGYGVVAFAVLQVAEPVMHGLHLPDAVLSVIVVLLGVGFPVVIVLAWIFDLNAAGVERTPSVAIGGDAAAPAPVHRLKVALALAGVGLVIGAPGVLWFFVSHHAARASGAGVASVAVLPFADLSPQKDQEYFSDGVAEEILNALSRVEGLRVPGRISSFSFRGRSVDLATIGRQLNVGSVLEGSVRRDGGRVRVTAELVNVADGYRVWSQTWDRELTGIFAVQEEIAAAVVSAMRIRLLPRGATGPAAAPTTNPDAYSAYLVGRQAMSRLTLVEYQRANEALERSVQLDPAYGPAWALLAIARFWIADSAKSVAEIRDGYSLAIDAAERAVALAPDLADGYAARAFLRAAARWEWAAAVSDIDRALALNPGRAETWVEASWVYVPAGRLDDAVAAARRATELDPLSPVAWARYGNRLYEADRLDDAQAALERSLAMQPDQDHGGADLVLVLVAKGRAREALDVSRGLRADAFRLAVRAVALHALGESADAEGGLRHLVEHHGEGFAFQLAEVYAQLGDRDEAFAWLDRAVAQRDSGMALVAARPTLRSLHGDPRFDAVLRKTEIRAPTRATAHAAAR